MTYVSRVRWHASGIAYGTALTPDNVSDNMANLKSFKTFKAAAAHAAGRPIIKAGNLYLAGEISSITQVEILDGYTYVAQVGLGHLARLGNANHATPHPSFAGKHADIFKTI